MFINIDIKRKKKSLFIKLKLNSPNNKHDIQ